MDLTAVTVGIPVRDLEAATEWYRAAFDLGPVDLEPIEGLVEFKLGAIWLQLALDLDHAGGEGISLNLSVRDATAERKRLADLGLDVTAVHRIEGVVDIFTLTDPEGNKVGFVTELA